MKKQEQERDEPRNLEKDGLEGDEERKAERENEDREKG